jgi:hypothetical protein
MIGVQDGTVAGLRDKAGGIYKKRVKRQDQDEQ